MVQKILGGCAGHMRCQIQVNHFMNVHTTKICFTEHCTLLPFTPLTSPGLSSDYWLFVYLRTMGLPGASQKHTRKLGFFPAIAM